jgi:toxin ParE1/3/4
MRMVARDPTNSLARERPELLRGVRSLHVRHARHEAPAGKVKAPVHVIYYRVVAPEVIEIVRILHERMEPSRHIGAGPKT